MDKEENQNQLNLFENNENDFNISIKSSDGKDFNGPFELLYSLVKERKMDILNINLEEVIKLYVTYIKTNLNKLKIDNLTEYLLMATYLLEQKSKKILPSIETDEQALLEIERDKYIQRLLVYKQYQEIVPQLIEKMANRFKMYEKPHQSEEEKFNILKEMDVVDYIPTMDLNVILKAMQKVYLKLLHKKKERNIKDKYKLIGIYEISVEEVQNEIMAFFNPKPDLFKISFTDYFETIDPEKFTKRYFVVVFLALLVLVMNGLILLEQNNFDEEIFIVKINSEGLAKNGN